MVSTETPSTSQPPNPNPTGYPSLQHIYMNSTEVNLQTCNQQYGMPPEIAPSEANDQPPATSGHLQILQPNVYPPS
jgi:hypothetical protein|uniref:Uncharacterized protein n=1 Tax=Picea sitchensis TaxID=3332 RepID=A0A6B9XUW2_PICSI|nr:hypothetical protein Q903MT_gene6764 [Picea sitchensis]